MPNAVLHILKRELARDLRGRVEQKDAALWTESERLTWSGYEPIVDASHCSGGLVRYDDDGA